MTPRNECKRWMAVLVAMVLIAGSAGIGAGADGPGAAAEPDEEAQTGT